MSIMEETARGIFHPTKVIVLSELPTREKEKYYQLLAYSNSKFRRDSEGRYVANVRLLAPNVKKIEGGGRKKDLSNYSLVFQERLRKLKEEGFINVRIIGVEQFDYNSFPRFTALIAFNGDTIRPKAKPLSWIMKIVEDIYDHRFSHEKNDVEREEDNPSYDLMLLIFPVFVVRRLGTNVGLKALVDQTCWDLMYNTHIYRRDYLELEVFGRFLQEFYDHDDLLFYLYVRSVIAKVLHINFKTRWTKSDGPGRQPKSLWMSHRECAHVARIVFGTDNEQLYRNFMALITPQMVGQLTETTDSRRMDITEYLHLSVVGYHQSQLHSQNATGASGERHLIPLPGQVVPTAPVPIPDSESHYFEDSTHVNGQQPEFDGTAAAAAAAADLHAAGRRSYSQQQHQQQDDQAYELEEEDWRAERARAAGVDPMQDDYPVSNDDEGGGHYDDDAYLLQKLASAAAPTLDDYNAEQELQYQQQQQQHYVDGNHHHEPYRFDEEGDMPGTTHNDVYNAGVAAEDEDDGHFEVEHGEAAGQEEEHSQLEDMPNEFEVLQLQREREFMDYLCEPLSGTVPPEYAQMIEADLSERLRQTVNLFLSDKRITDTDSLDAFLVDFLGLEQLRADMESTRDELVEHLMSQGGTGGEEHDQDVQMNYPQ